MTDDAIIKSAVDLAEKSFLEIFRLVTDLQEKNAVLQAAVAEEDRIRRLLCMDCLHHETPSDKAPCSMCRVLRSQMNWEPKHPVPPT